MRKKLVERIGGVAFLAIPAGLIAWLFWPLGWKISVVGFIVFTTIVLMLALVKKKEEKQ